MSAYRYLQIFNVYILFAAKSKGKYDSFLVAKSTDCAFFNSHCFIFTMGSAGVLLMALPLVHLIKMDF